MLFAFVVVCLGVLRIPGISVRVIVMTWFLYDLVEDCCDCGYGLLVLVDRS